MLVCASIFIEGALLDYNTMQERIAKVQQQSDQFEQKSKDTNIKLAKQAKEFKKKNMEHKQVVYKYIHTEVAKYDNECKIPDAFVNAHNQSAEPTK